MVCRCRSAISNARPNGRYHRTQKTLTSASKWRPLNSAGRFRLIQVDHRLQHYQRRV